MLREYDCPHCGARVDAMAQRARCLRCGGELPQVSTQVGWQPEKAVEGMTPAEMLLPQADPRHARRRVGGKTKRRGDPIRVVAAILWGGLVVALGVVAWCFLDLDGDGMAAWREIQAHASPFAGDSDGDGLADGWEADRGLEPGRADTDGDGLGDGEELPRGLDPRAADTDHDGTPDGQGPDPAPPSCGLGGAGGADARCDLVGPPPVPAGLAGNVVYAVALAAAAFIAVAVVRLWRRPAPQGL